MNWYDRAEICDILFGWDPRAEAEFILGASASWGIASPRRVLEPFCGSGRMLRPLPGSVGFDLNPNMLRWAARPSRVFRADAARFAVRRSSFDLAHCLIDGEGSFEIASVFDRRYDLADPVELHEVVGSAVLVLRRS